MIGSAMAANKIAGARAAMCTDQTLARYAREHNGANVLALGATLISVDAARAIVDTWIATPMGEARLATWRLHHSPAPEIRVTVS